MTALPRLTAWEALAPDQRSVALLMDSTGELDSGGPGLPTGHLLRQRMARRWPMRGAGVRCTWTDDWSFTTGGNAWTAAGATDTWNVGPLRGLNSFTAVMRANTAAKIATWTKPSWFTGDITSFKLGVVDGASSANFSYRIDGGSWTNVSHTWNQNNSLDEITISSAVTSTVEIRGANAAGTAVTMYLVWLEPITGTGAVVHDMSASGESLFGFERTMLNPLTGEVGDGLAWVDVLQPKLTLIMFTNDIGVYDVSGFDYEASLQAVVDRCAPYGKVVPIMYWGQNRDVTFTSCTTTNGSAAITGTGFAVQHVGIPITGTNIPASTTIATYTDATHVTLSHTATGSGSGLTFTGHLYEGKAPQQAADVAAVATLEGAPYVDMWTRYGDYDTVNALGYMADTLHPNDAGVREIVMHNLWPLVARGTR